LLAVAVFDGVSVAVAVGVLLAVGVNVIVGVIVAVGVIDGVGVSVGLGVLLAVNVIDGVGVIVGVGSGVLSQASMAKAQNSTAIRCFGASMVGVLWGSGS